MLQPVAGDAGVDDLVGESRPVDDGCAQPRIGEGLGRVATGLVAGDGDGDGSSDNQSQSRIRVGG